MRRCSSPCTSRGVRCCARPSGRRSRRTPRRRPSSSASSAPPSVPTSSSGRPRRRSRTCRQASHPVRCCSTRRRRRRSFGEYAGIPGAGCSTPISPPTSSFSRRRSRCTRPESPTSRPPPRPRTPFGRWPATWHSPCSLWASSAWACSACRCWRVRAPMRCAMPWGGGSGWSDRSVRRPAFTASSPSACWPASASSIHPSAR